MIQIHPDYLFFKMSCGETIPCSAEVATVELMGAAAELCDPELVRSAASAVLHYFKNELGRDCVSVAEFAEALVRVLRGFGLKVCDPDPPPSPEVRVSESDLRRLACACDKGFELAFFPKLRDELRHQLSQSPRVLRFTGLRGCVKLLVGAQRWGPRCQDLNDQIIEFLRQCLSEESPPRTFSLVVN